jgi:hypothetical protein
MAPVETEYYDLVSVFMVSASLASLNSIQLQLGVPVDVNDTDLKKAYRKAAMKVRLSPPNDPSCPSVRMPPRSTTPIRIRPQMQRRNSKR